MSIQSSEYDPLLEIQTASLSEDGPSSSYDNSCLKIASSFAAERRRVGSTWYEAAFLIINATLGAGLLNFPQAYEKAGGTVPATAIMMFLVVLVIAALLLLAHCSEINDSATYQDVILGMCGPTAQRISSAVVALYMFGACIAFLVVIGDQTDRALASFYGPTFCHYWYMNRTFLLPSVALVFVLPMCFSKRIDFLKYPSALGVISALYLVFLVIYQYYMLDAPASGAKSRPTVWTDSFLVIPVICFGFQCHISSVPVYSCLKTRNLRMYSYSVFTAMLFCFLCYGSVAVFGYWTFGDAVPSDVLLEYDARSAVVLIGVIMLAIKTIVAYPMLLFCGRLAVDGLWVHFRGIPQSFVDYGEKKRRIRISLLWFASTLLLAVFTPSIGVVIRALGSLAAIIILVFPGLCLLHLILKKDPNYYLLKDRILLLVAVLFQALGAFIFGVVLTQTFSQLKNSAETIVLCN